METAEMILKVLETAGSVISRVIKLTDAGNHEEARSVVKRFVATTESELARDRATAEQILKDRFPG